MQGRRFRASGWFRSYRIGIVRAGDWAQEGLTTRHSVDHDFSMASSRIKLFRLLQQLVLLVGLLVSGQAHTALHAEAGDGAGEEKGAPTEQHGQSDGCALCLLGGGVPPTRTVVKQVLRPVAVEILAPEERPATHSQPMLRAPRGPPENATF
ncbi:MAG: hypothetical protein ACI8QS_000675 [Planctomycetota bacterium]|jgi:hypothetical protein